MTSFPAIDALLAAYTPLPSPAERSQLRRNLDLTLDDVAEALGVHPATLKDWEEDRVEPEPHLRPAYAYFLTRASTAATDPAQPHATDTGLLTQPALCVLCGNPATQHVDGYPQHLTADDCTTAKTPQAIKRTTTKKTPAASRTPAAPGIPPQRSATPQDPIREAVTAALAAHDGDPSAAAAALTARAIPDAMRLLNATRVGDRYDIVHHPPLPDMLRRPSPRTPDRIWEARPNWQRRQALQAAGPVAALDINGAYLSALKTHLPLGRLESTNPEPHDRGRSGIHLITPAAWEHDTYLPNPLGARQEPGPVWITEPTLRLLLRLSGPKYALCDPPVIHESYTSTSTEGLLEKFRSTLRDARTRALEEKDQVTLTYVKAMYCRFVSTLGESTYNRELCRPDWMHMIHAQAFTNLWLKAYKAHKEGLELVRVCGTDELHVQGDWRRVFPKGQQLSQIKLKDT